MFKLYNNDQITQWINNIQLLEDGEGSEDYLFAGDGLGENEICAATASTATLEEYIKYCEYQIELAQRYLQQSTPVKSNPRDRYVQRVDTRNVNKDIEKLMGIKKLPRY